MYIHTIALFLYLCLFLYYVLYQTAEGIRNEKFLLKGVLAFLFTINLIENVYKIYKRHFVKEESVIEGNN